MDLSRSATGDALADCGSFARLAPDGRWRLYHDSFRDYLHNDDDIGSGPEQDLAIAERLIGLFRTGGAAT